MLPQLNLVGQLQSTRKEKQHAGENFAGQTLAWLTVQH
jgi:hypothetical protein